eukprot:scaffold9692_cov96-Isochrysis_galbana.AAC.4
MAAALAVDDSTICASSMISRHHTRESSGDRSGRASDAPYETLRRCGRLCACAARPPASVAVRERRRVTRGKEARVAWRRRQRRTQPDVRAHA